MTPHTLPRSSDPWAVLDLPVGSGDGELRAAYLRKIRQFPPDRAPEQFERIRDAYDVLRDPRRRSELIIMSADPKAEFVSLLGEQTSQRRFTGPGPWLAALEMI